MLRHVQRQSSCHSWWYHAYIASFRELYVKQIGVVNTPVALMHNLRHTGRSSMLLLNRFVVYLFRKQHFLTWNNQSHADTLALVKIARSSATLSVPRDFMLPISGPSDAPTGRDGRTAHNYTDLSQVCTTLIATLFLIYLHSSASHYMFSCTPHGHLPLFLLVLPCASMFLVYPHLSLHCIICPHARLTYISHYTRSPCAC